jgi:ABC-type antimicrobial peptide transport system permease subunit
MFSGILALRQTLTGTLLGDFVLLQTATPQIAGCVLALLLTFLSITDLLLLQVRERRQEIGLLQAIGWRIALIQRVFVQEGIILAIIGTLPGVIVAQWILNNQHAAQNIVAPFLLALTVIIVMILVAALASLPALRAIRRLPLVEILHAE